MLPKIVHIVEKFILLNVLKLDCDIAIRLGMAARQRRLIREKMQNFRLIGCHGYVP